MKYSVRYVRENSELTEDFSSLEEALSFFTEKCKSGFCAAIYNYLG